MLDSAFVAHVQALHAKGPEGLPQMRELLKNGNLTRLIELAALGAEKKKNLPKRRAQQQTFAGMQFPDWWPTKAWENYLAMRKKKRAATTERAVEMILAEVITLRAAGHDPTACLDQSTLKGWTEVYAPKGSNGAAAPAVLENTNLAGWMSRLEIFFVGDDECPKGGWSPKWGPRPDQAGCVAPPAILARFSNGRAAG